MGICCIILDVRMLDCFGKFLVCMCLLGNYFFNFVDIGDKVVLFVDFGD